MTNSWSLLFDELNMSNQDFWHEDGSLTGNPGAASSDTIIFGGSGTDTINFGAAQYVPTYDYLNSVSQDTISFSSSTVNLDVPDLPTTDNTNGRWKYNEDVILKEIKEYLGGTYRSHYASPESKTQTLDLIEAVGDAEPFCRSNALKYLSRFGKKDGKSKQDILKAIHYCILLYHFAGLCNENSQPYETF